MKTRIPQLGLALIAASLAMPAYTYAAPQAQSSVVVNIAEPFFSVKEWAGEIAVPVRLSQAAAEPVKVELYTTDASARAGSDYTAVDDTITFAPGETEQLVHIPILNEALVEGDESFNLVLRTAFGAELGSQNESIITIASKAHFMLEEQWKSVYEYTGYVEVRILQVGYLNPGETAVITYATKDGSAHAEKDYQSTAGSLTFTSTQRSATVQVPIINDGQYEPNEGFRLEIYGSAEVDVDISNYIDFAIWDDDASAHFSAARYEVHEGAGSVQLTVERSGPSSSPATFGYTAVGGSATAGADFPAGVAGSISFAPGESAKQISIPISEDALLEGEEFFTVQLTGGRGAGIGSPAEARVVILPNDAVAFAAASAHAAEGTSLIVAVELNAPSSQPVTVSYRSSSGSAVNDVDFKSLKGTLSFAPGETRKYIEVNLLPDKAIEPDEDFTLQLLSPQGAQLGSPGVMTITIDGDRTCDLTTC